MEPQEERPPPRESVPLPWVVRFAPLVRAGGTVLDVACGGGRHLRYFRARGHPVVGVDQDVRGLADLAGQTGVGIVQADLEQGEPWPLAGRQFAAVVIANYLNMPLWPVLRAALGPEGVLIIQTFGRGQGRHGRPSSPEFLIRSGASLEWAQQAGLQIVAYEHGRLTGDRPAIIQRLCAVNPGAPAADLDGDPEPWPLGPS